MLLTINNLPSQTRYSDVKSLIQSKCGPLEVILDNLIVKNKLKSVTVGLGDEEDAAILVRKINGLFIDGVQLYVEDPRKNKKKEHQPYRSAVALPHAPKEVSQQISYGFPNTGSHSLDYTTQSQNMMPVMPINQIMMNYGMQAYGMVIPQTGQNAIFSGYDQSMMQNIPGSSQMQNQNFNDLANSDMYRGPNREQRKNILEDIDYQPNAKKIRYESDDQKKSNNCDRNSRFRDYNPQNNINNDFRGESHEVSPKFVNKGLENSRKRKQSDREISSQSSKRNDKDDLRKVSFGNHNDRPRLANQYAGNSSNGNRDRSSGSRSNFTISVRTNSQQASGSEIIPSLFDIPTLTRGEYRGHKKIYESKYDDNRNPRSFHQDPSLDYQQRNRPEFAQETRKPSLMTEYKQRSAMPESRFANNSETYQDYFERQREDLDHQRHFPDRNEFGNHNLHRQERLDPWANNKSNRNTHEKRNNGDRERHFDNDSYKTSRSVHRPTVWTDNHSKNFDDSHRSIGSKFHASEEVHSDWKNKNPPHREPKLTRREPGPSDSRPSFPNTERARPLTKGRYDLKPKNSKRSPSIPGPPNQEKPAPKAHVQESLTSLMNKDTTYRGQATSQIAKDMIQNLQINNSEARTILKTLKVCIRSRLEVILGDSMANSMEEVVQKYRQKFNVKQDAAFFDVVLQKLEAEHTGMPSTKGNIDAGVETAPGEPTQHTTDAPKRPLPKSKAKNKPALRQDGKIPKYPNADKNQMKRQKQQAKLELKNEDMYELDEPLKTVLNEELDAICQLFNNYECSNEEEEKITNIIKSKVVEDFKKVVRINATKRLLNINSNLLVRIFIYGTPPKGNELNTFLKNFSVNSCRKAKAGKFLVATCNNFENYDKLLAMGLTNIGDCRVSIKPFQLTGCKTRMSRAEVIKRKEEFIQRQIDNADQSNQSKVTEDNPQDFACDNPDDLEDY